MRYDHRMPDLNGDPTTNGMTRLLTQPALIRWMYIKSRQLWYRLRPKRALRDFQELGGLVQGLQAQDAEGDVDPTALRSFATELETLSIFPPAIRRTHARSALKKELCYLATCMGVHAEDGHEIEDYLSLPLAQKRFAKGARPSDPDWQTDALGAGYDRYFKKPQP